MKPTNLPTVVTVLLCLIALSATAQESADQSRDEPQTRQAQAVSKPVFEVIEEAQVLIDEERWTEAISTLIALVDKGGLSDYEAANVYRYVGFAYHSQDDTQSAIVWFGKVLAIAELEEQTRKSTLYTMAQLQMVDEQYDHALSFLQQWFELEPNAAPSAHYLHAQILYQLERYKDLITPLQEAIRTAEERNIEVKEEWYALLSFAFYQLEEYEEVRDTNKTLTMHWPKKRYWLALANAYRELNEDDNLLAAYELALLQGFLNSDSELVTMAQLYLQADVPLKAAQLLDREMESGRVSKNSRNYRLLSQAWMLAREDDEAVPPLKIAAELDESGDIYFRLAATYHNLGDSEACVRAAKAGIAKGNLKNPDFAQLILGTCLFEQNQYLAAIESFYIAGKTPRSAQRANQWIRITNLEISRIEAIQKAEANADQRFRELAERRTEISGQS